MAAKSGRPARRTNCTVSSFAINKERYFRDSASDETISEMFNPRAGNVGERFPPTRRSGVQRSG